MTTNNQTVALVKGMSDLARAKFGPGMLLHHDDLEQLNIYTRELSRLMFRSLFGCGVICGLVVDWEFKCGKLYITVEAGLALDCCGDPVYVPQPQRILVDENCDPDIPNHLWVVLCGTEKCCAPRTAMCASDEDGAPSVCTRERDGFEIRILREPPECVCRCLGRLEDTKTSLLLDDEKCKCVNPDLECYKAHYDGKCGCNCADCSDCDCECILLARLDNSGDKDNPNWTVDHSVRRFIRPVLMRDPQVEIEEGERIASAQPQAAQAKSSAQSRTSEQAKASSKARSGKT